MFFVAVLNWTVNARVLVPAIFPAALLCVRWLETLDDSQRWLSTLKYGLWPVAGITLILAFVDYEFAAASKQFAQTTARQLIKDGETVTFAGHWGFQFYMEQEGAKALDHSAGFPIAGEGAFEQNKLPKPGEVIVYPTNNSGIEPKLENIEMISEKSFPSLFCLHLMSHSANAGFYSSLSGDLPYGFSEKCVCDRFTVYRVVESP